MVYCGGSLTADLVRAKLNGYVVEQPYSRPGDDQAALNTTRDTVRPLTGLRSDEIGNHSRLRAQAMSGKVQFQAGQNNENVAASQQVSLLKPMRALSGDWNIINVHFTASNDVRVRQPALPLNVLVLVAFDIAVDPPAQQRGRRMSGLSRRRRIAGLEPSHCCGNVSCRGESVGWLANFCHSAASDLATFMFPCDEFAPHKAQ